jgi:2-phosphosulfolactate phosphatase
MRRIDVCLSPTMFQCYANSSTIVIIIDAIRASASICTAFMNGVELIIPVSEKEVALEYRKKGYIIAGEREGKKIDGFDFGNSPFNFSEENIKGKKLAFTTTNGTRVINIVKDADIEDVELIIGSFLNISSIAKYVSSKDKDVMILCSAWKDTVNIEDTLFAGKLVNLLSQNNEYELYESANLSQDIFLNSDSSHYDFIMKNSPRLKAKSKLLEKDFRYCLSEDLTDIIPYLEGDNLVIKKT